MGGGFEGQFTAVAGTTGDAAGDAAGDATANGRAVTGGMKVGEVRSRAPQPVKTNTATTSAAIRRSTQGDDGRRRSQIGIGPTYRASMDGRYREPNVMRCATAVALP